MKQIERIVLEGQLPESFFVISNHIYSGLAYKPEESISIVNKIFALEKDLTDIVLYTDHENIRLVGMFSKNSNACLFGWWETVEAHELNKEAFKLLEAEAIAKQKTSIIGPINFNTFHNYRLRMDETPAWNMFDREPVNPPYYSTILQGLGYTFNTTFESRRIPKEKISEVYVEKQLFLDEVRKIPFDFIPINPASWLKYEDELYELIHAIFSKNPFYKRIDREEFKLLYNIDFAKKLCPYSSVLFRDRKSERLAAISLCHPNYLTLKLPAGTCPVFERDFEKPETKILLVKSVGVHPDFRNQGLMTFLGAYGMLSFKEHYDEVIFCTMRSDNYSLQFTNGLAYEKAEYALFEKQLIL